MPKLLPDVWNTPFPGLKRQTSNRPVVAGEGDEAEKKQEENAEKNVAKEQEEKMGKEAELEKEERKGGG